MIPISVPYITEEDVEAVTNVLRSGYIAYGPKAREFEELFASYIGVQYGAAVSNGTVGLYIALKALGVGEGDEVITPAFSFIATANTILLANAKPIFADIDPETYTIDPEDVAEKITGRTKAIVLVHLYGHPCDMKAFMELAEDHKLYLIEDASQAHGAEYNGSKVGGLGDIGVFSLYATKNMTTGEGGILVTDDPGIIKKVKYLMNHGQEGKYNHVALGYNFRMPDILAAMGIVQLKRLDMLNERRRQNAYYYNNRLKKLDSVITPYEDNSVKHVYHQYVIRASDRDGLKKYLEESGIQTDIHYPKPIYRQKLYVDLGYGDLRLENSEEAAREVLSIPVHPYLTKRDLNKVADKIIEYYESR